MADVRTHGTTLERPTDRLAQEKSFLRPLPAPERLEPFTREDRQVGRDGYVQWDRSWYGWSIEWAGRTVQVQSHPHLIELWSDDQRLIVHPRATRPGQRFKAPGQWAGIKIDDRPPVREPLAVQIPTVQVERRSLKAYEEFQGVAGR